MGELSPYDKAFRAASRLAMSEAGRQALIHLRDLIQAPSLDCVNKSAVLGLLMGCWTGPSAGSYREAIVDAADDLERSIAIVRREELLQEDAAQQIGGRDGEVSK